MKPTATVPWLLRHRVFLCLLFCLWLPGVLLAGEPDQQQPEVDRAAPEAALINGEGKLRDSVREGAVVATKEKHEVVEVEEPGSEGVVAWVSVGFFHAFVAAFSVIIVSEIGDKTFFIAAIMAMTHSRCLVFSGALSALGLMTFLSVVLGFATMVIPRAVTFYVSTGLLALFGVKMLYEGWNMSSDEGREEFDEVSEELRKREEVETVGDQEQGLSTRLPLRRRLRCLGPVTSAIFLQAFTLTFLAEWGDRSQITTIILAARENPVGITIGGTLGHALCTALAVIGGKMVAQRISVKTGETPKPVWNTVQYTYIAYIALLRE
ncbi:Transmembrane protein 165 [Geodia barretti]|uniref:GDT1 family protein n=1 Tax=Geodia barretti TaxID=519541 RepID=A0AA35T088_GEOBA|nr:Transmembrane protein 165 [Geodia barretti]